MKWIETLKIQAASGQETALEAQLIALTTGMAEHPDCQGLRRISVCQHATNPWCFVLHLWWETPAFPTQGSRPGLSLIPSLQAFGLVDHAVWLEKENNSDKTSERMG